MKRFKVKYATERDQAVEVEIVEAEEWRDAATHIEQKVEQSGTSLIMQTVEEVE